MQHIFVSALSRKINKGLQEVSGPQISSANLHISGLKFLDSRSVCKCGNSGFAICDHIFLAICEFAIIFCGFKTSTNPQKLNFSPDKYKLTWHFVVYVGEKQVLEANQCGSGSKTLPCNFSDLRFADWYTKEICGFCDLRTGTLRNFRICDCGMSPRICGFAICGLTKKFACPPLVFTLTIDNARRIGRYAAPM